MSDDPFKLFSGLSMDRGATAIRQAYTQAIENITNLVASQIEFPDAETV